MNVSVYVRSDLRDNLVCFAEEDGSSSMCAGVMCVSGNDGGAYVRVLVFQLWATGS